MLRFLVSDLEAFQAPAYKIPLNPVVYILHVVHVSRQSPQSPTPSFPKTYVLRFLYVVCDMKK